MAYRCDKPGVGWYRARRSSSAHILKRGHNHETSKIRLDIKLEPLPCGGKEG